VPADLVADRLAIADLVHAYAQGIDRQDVDAVASLFSEDALFVAYAEPGATEPTTSRRGREKIHRSIEGGLRQYRATVHTIGNHLATVGGDGGGGDGDGDGDRATGETRCVAYHVLGEEGAETLMVWHLRYLDEYLRTTEGWRISERVLRVDVVTYQPLDAR
jgi:ketosteroid isomerase-like protein